MKKQIRITQIDGRLPNIALMRLAHWHKNRGDTVYYTTDVEENLGEPEWDTVYGSSIFDYTKKKREKFIESFPAALLAGTGTGNPVTLEEMNPAIGKQLDYSFFPEFTPSIGFLQRGCRLKCAFCVVPWKEGQPYSVNGVYDIWRGPGHPKKIHLLDNDFFGVPEWRRNIEEIRDGGFRVCINQGINVRMMTVEIAEALASIQYRDMKFQSRRIYTAWDNIKHEKWFFRGIDLMEAAGIPAKHIMVYMLIGYEEKESWEDIYHRFDRMVERGLLPYPMVYDNARRDLKDFQRWAITGLYRRFPFREYEPPRKLKRDILEYIFMGDPP